MPQDRRSWWRRARFDFRRRMLQLRSQRPAMLGRKLLVGILPGVAREVRRRRFLGVMGMPIVAACADLRGGGGVPRGDGEDFWADVARSFTVDRSLINLNNGGVSPAPATTPGWL